MGLFGNKKSKIDLENIISVVLLEQTQLYGKKNNWDLVSVIPLAHLWLWSKRFQPVQG